MDLLKEAEKHVTEIHKITKLIKDEEFLLNLKTVHLTTCQRLAEYFRKKETRSRENEVIYRMLAESEEKMASKYDELIKKNRANIDEWKKAYEEHMKAANKLEKMFKGV